MRFFEVLHVEIAQKLQILKISPIFSNFSLDFQFSLIFGGVMEKKIAEQDSHISVKENGL